MKYRQSWRLLSVRSSTTDREPANPTGTCSGCHRLKSDDLTGAGNLSSQQEAWEQKKPCLQVLLPMDILQAIEARACLYVPRMGILLYGKSWYGKINLGAHSSGLALQKSSPKDVTRFYLMGLRDHHSAPLGHYRRQSTPQA